MASIMRRANHRVIFCAASPTPTSVMQVQPGGSPSSVERVDVIGSSFPLKATGIAPTAALPPVSASIVTM
jgi:hypothetical protein